MKKLMLIVALLGIVTLGVVAVNAATPVYPPVDVNQDGVVNIGDIVITIGAFGTTPASPNWNPAADVNGDGVVNITDIVLVINAFGTSFK